MVLRIPGVIPEGFPRTAPAGTRITISVASGGHPEACDNPDMSEATYYRDHWVEIEPERLARYEEMFQWRPEMEPLLEPAELAAGQEVVDYGCGPGSLALEIAGRIGSGGRVHGVDLNADMIAVAERRAAAAELDCELAWHHIEEDVIPLADASVDRVVCKNVLEYVDDVEATLAEFHRVTRQGGLVHVIDSDWGLLTIEPLGPERMGELFAAAKAAYRTPLIGRRLYGAMRAAGFAEVKVRILTGADTRGRMLHVLRNMVGYAKDAGGYDAATGDRLLADAEKAIEEQSWLALLPQFLVTGTV